MECKKKDAEKGTRIIEPGQNKSKLSKKIFFLVDNFCFLVPSLQIEHRRLQSDLFCPYGAWPIDNEVWGSENLSEPASAPCSMG
jgi:hypothetical protein